jgi:hypothetical protein
MWIRIRIQNTASETVFFNRASCAGAVLQQQLCRGGAIGGPGGGWTEHNTGGTPVRWARQHMAL